MTEQRDERIIALAIERGLVTAEQVEACRRLQAEADAPISLLQLLIQQGRLTPDEVVGLVSGERLPDLERCEMVEEAGSGVLGSACVDEDPEQGKRCHESARGVGVGLVEVPGNAHPQWDGECCQCHVADQDEARVGGLEPLTFSLGR